MVLGAAIRIGNVLSWFNGTCDDGTFYSILASTTGSIHMWLPSSWNVATENSEVKMSTFNFKQIFKLHDQIRALLRVAMSET